MTESQLYAKEVRPSAMSIGAFVRRVEQEMFPDVYMALNGKVLWAEMKIVSSKSFPVKPPWREGQLAWIREHQKANGTDSVCLIVEHAGSIYWLPPKIQYEQEDMICQKKTYLKSLLMRSLQTIVKTC